MEEKKKGNGSKVIIALLILIIIAIVGGFLFWKFVYNKDDGAMKYEASVVVSDENALQKAVDEAYAKAKEGQMSLEMKTEATSTNGKDFSCYLMNSAKNNYEMYLTLFLDETQEQIYQTGRIRLGEGIDSFSLEEPLEKGRHTCTLVYNQLEEDGKTIHAQVNVELTLVVN